MKKRKILIAAMFLFLQRFLLPFRMMTRCLANDNETMQQYLLQLQHQLQQQK